VTFSILRIESAVAAQIVFRGEWKIPQVVQRFQIVGMYARLVKRLLIVGDVAVGMIECPFQPLELKRPNLVARSDFDRVETFAARREVDALKL
jgi:hypothetical protein